MIDFFPLGGWLLIALRICGTAALAFLVWRHARGGRIEQQLRRMAVAGGQHTLSAARRGFSSTTATLGGTMDSLNRKHVLLLLILSGIALTWYTGWFTDFQSTLNYGLGIALKILLPFLVLATAGGIGIMYLVRRWLAPPVQAQAPYAAPIAPAAVVPPVATPPAAAPVVAPVATPVAAAPAVDPGTPPDTDPSRLTRFARDSWLSLGAVLLILLPLTALYLLGSDPTGLMPSSASASFVHHPVLWKYIVIFLALCFTFRWGAQLPWTLGWAFIALRAIAFGAFAYSVYPHIVANLPAFGAYLANEGWVMAARVVEWIRVWMPQREVFTFLFVLLSLGGRIKVVAADGLRYGGFARLLSFLLIILISATLFAICDQRFGWGVLAYAGMPGISRIYLVEGLFAFGLLAFAVSYYATGHLPREQLRYLSAIAMLMAAFFFLGFDDSNRWWSGLGPIIELLMTLGVWGFVIPFTYMALSLVPGLGWLMSKVAIIAILVLVLLGMLATSSGLVSRLAGHPQKNAAAECQYIFPPGITNHITVKPGNWSGWLCWEETSKAEWATTTLKRGHLWAEFRDANKQPVNTPDLKTLTGKSGSRQVAIAFHVSPDADGELLISVAVNDK